MFTAKEVGHDCVLHVASYLSTALSKLLHHTKTKKNTKKFWEFGENDSFSLFLFYTLKYFETSILFLETTIKLIAGCLVWKSNNNFYQDNLDVSFRFAFQKRPGS